MKAMFVGGRFHAQLMEIPKGDTIYVTLVKLDGRMVELTYEAKRHPQLFELTATDGKPVVELPVDFYLNERIRMWISNISKWSSSALSGGATTNKPANS